MTFGSGAPCAKESSRELTPGGGRAGGSCAELAREALLAFTRGERPAELLARLVDEVLADDAVRLALEVRAGGPHSDRRAIELVALLAAVDEGVRADEASA